MQYLITTFTDSIGHQHSHVTKAKDNQTFTVVEAESKEEALENVNKKPKKPVSYYTPNGSRVTLHEVPSEEELQRLFGKDNK